MSVEKISLPPSPQLNTDPLLSEEQAAEYLGGVSTRSLQRWRIERLGPTFIRVGRLIRYRRSALDVYLAAGEQKPAAA
jgi:excisionase family DNA binding protein